MSANFKARMRSFRRSVASVVALVLIVAAFVVGWAAGRGGSDEQVASSPPSGGTGEPVTYTCSMHRQVRLPDADAKCPICFMGLVPVSAGGGEEERVLTMTPAAARLADVRTTRVERRFPEHTVRMLGTIDYDETRIATIAAHFPGRLDRLFVDYTGVHVNAGDHLAVIYSPELVTTQAELQQALRAAEMGGDQGALLRSTALKRLESSREKLRLWGLSELQIEEMERRAEPIEQLTIFSPISGVVVERRAVEGRYVQTGDDIYKLADLSRLWVRLEAYESQLPWLRYGQDVEFTTVSLPGVVLRGRIAFVDPAVSRETRTVRIRLNVDNADGRLKPGMFVRATVRARVAGDATVVDDSLAGKWISPMHPEIIKDSPGACDICGMPLVPIEELGYVTRTGDIEPPLVIPATVPLVTGRRAIAYVKLPDRDVPTFEGREIVLGARAGDHYIVESGLREGEEVVTHGAFKIDSAMQIAAKPSMMNPGPEPPASRPARARFAVPEDFLFALKPIYASYFDAQEALAADDGARFRQAAGDLHSAVALVGETGLDGAGLDAWRRLEGVLHAKSEAAAEAADIAAARTVFEACAESVIELEERFGHFGARAHVVIFCPMAFDNRGATWLARTDQVENPYFGASMLRCGVVRATHAPLDAQLDGPKPEVEP